MIVVLNNQNNTIRHMKSLYPYIYKYFVDDCSSVVILDKKDHDKAQDWPKWY